MCGIAGVLARDAGRDVGPVLDELTAALAHRGPDGSGTVFLRGRSAAFGHRRLAIIDLEGGAQPMVGQDGRVAVTFNGEIYNHRELRRELTASGCVFRTQSDTEVLVHGWATWGRGLVERLNGIYAFAVWDAREREVWLARDPLGVKPLYCGVSGAGEWWFASELSAARVAGLVDGAIDRDAIDAYLVYRFVPAPRTPFTRAWKLPAGHLVRLPLDELPSEPSFQRFAADFAPPVVPSSAGEWREAVRAGLLAAVDRQLMSDVPVGSLLSGGVDSTVVTSVMSERLTAPPQCFAIGFDAADSELLHARRAATALHVPLDELVLSEEDFVAGWGAHVARMSEPIANSGVPLIALLCARVGETHKVVLSGQGADEPLGGYPRHTVERLARAGALLAPLAHALPERLAGSDRVARVRRILGERDEARRFSETLAVFSPSEARALAGRSDDVDAIVAPVRYWTEAAAGQSDSFNRLLHVDARLSLADDLLTVADHASMRSGVELRVPFLDLRLVSLLERMPARFKVSLSGERKWLYREAVAELVPEALRPALIGRRARLGRKLGFTTPLERWYPRWLGEQAEDFLTGAQARLPALLEGDRLRAYVQGVRDRRAPRMRQMISLFVLESWLRA